VARWHMYVGTFTRHFGDEVARLQSSGADWWKGLSRSPAQQERPAVDPGAPYWPAGGGFAEGVEWWSFDDADGSVRYRHTVAGDFVCPQFLALHPTLPVLYAIEYGRPTRVWALAIREDGSLEPRSATDTSGLLGNALTVHPSGNFVYAAHWGDGTLSALALDADGMVLGVEVVDRPASDGVDRAYHHDIRVTPNGRAVVLTDVGGDEVIVYRADADGTVTPPIAGRIAFPEKSGPRHLELHPSGGIAYVVGEWDSTLYVLEADEGVPTRIIGRHPTIPSDFDRANKTSEVHMHPDGRTLYVGNRDHDSIAVFAVDDLGGVESLGHQSSLGRGPASVKVHPGGRHLVAGNVYSGDIAVFEIDDDRLLHPVGDPVDARAPRYLSFVEARA
jgi:6-phosphogluconolactonase